MSRDFNDVIALDLKALNGFIIIHIIDHATRFSAAAVIKSKRKEDIVDSLFKHWIAIFGPPRTILSDNGGEFNNNVFRELGEQFNIIKTTAAESPWSNGIVERHNAVLGKMINKLLLDESVKYSFDVVVAWVVSAKTASKSCYGYSPNQLVFGRIPSFPSTLTNCLPALESSSSELILQHLKALHEARKAFIEAESNEKLRHALKSKTRVTTAVAYNLGDSVYYKRKDSDKWRGPGVIIGKENKQVLVKHGGFYVRVHPCSLQLIQKHNYIEGNTVTERNDSNKSSDQSNSQLSERHDNNVKSLRNEQVESDIESDFYPTIVNSLEHGEDDTSIEGIETLTTRLKDLSLHTESNDQSIDSISDNVNSPVISDTFPKVKSKIVYHNPESNSWNEALVLSRAGKSSGKNKSWFNIKYIKEDKHKSVDFSRIKGWKNASEEVLIAHSNDNNIEILQAKQVELQNWNKHKVYEEVEDNDQRVISVRWVKMIKLYIKLV